MTTGRQTTAKRRVLADRARGRDMGMTDATRELLHIALRLPPEERERLAQALYASLEPDEGDEDPEAVEAAWREEIKRRLRDIDEGRVKPVPVEDALARARQRLDEIAARRRA